MSFLDGLFDFLSSLRQTSTKGKINDQELPPISVVRSSNITPNNNKRLAAIQPKIEEDLVKVGNLPSIKPEEDAKIFASENAKDSDPTYGEARTKDLMSKYGLQDLNLAKTIVDTARAFGQSPEVMFRMARQESRFNPKAVNKHTQAQGLFQFLPSTWKDVQNRLGGADHGIVDAFDPAHNAKAAALYLNEIKKTLSKVKDGSQITDADLYLGHFSGPTRASQVLKSLQQGKGDMPANKIYLPREINANKTIFYTDGGKGRMRTLKEVYDVISSKMGEPIASVQVAQNVNKDKKG